MTPTGPGRIVLTRIGARSTASPLVNPSMLPSTAVSIETPPIGLRCAIPVRS